MFHDVRSDSSVCLCVPIPPWIACKKKKYQITFWYLQFILLKCYKIMHMTHCMTQAVRNVYSLLCMVMIISKEQYITCYHSINNVSICCQCWSILITMPINAKLVPLPVLQWSHLAEWKRERERTPVYSHVLFTMFTLTSCGKLLCVFFFSLPEHTQLWIR